MYRKIEDFVNDWKQNESNTLKIFKAITEDKKTTKIHPDVRSLERLAWHITETVIEIPSTAGLFATNPVAGLPMPSTMAGIIEQYQINSQLLIDEVQKKWKDDELEEEVPMYGDVWNKGTVLSVIIGHEVHHQSQMTVVMRVVGLPVPGTFGPSKEEWAMMGIPAQE